MRTRPFPSRRNRLIVEMPANEGIDINCTRLLCRPSSDEPPGPEPLCSDPQLAWDGEQCVSFGFIPETSGPYVIVANDDPFIGTMLDIPEDLNTESSYEIGTADNGNHLSFAMSFNSAAPLAYNGGSMTFFNAACEVIGTATVNVSGGETTNMTATIESMEMFVPGNTYYVHICPPTEPGE